MENYGRKPHTNRTVIVMNSIVVKSQCVTVLDTTFCMQSFHPINRSPLFIDTLDD